MTGEPVLTVPLEEGSSPFLLGDGIQIWSMRVTKRVASPRVSSSICQADNNHNKTFIQTDKIRNVDKPRDLQKTLDPTPGKLWGKERHEPARPHCCPHRIPTAGRATFSLGTGSAFSLPAPRCARYSCLGGGPY